MKSVFKWVESPIGPLKLVANEVGLAALLWANDNPRRVRFDSLTEDSSCEILLRSERQLREYFNGARHVFELPLAFSGTPFQIRVWKTLLTIPYGQTRSYRDVALDIEHPSAVRAVGAANGRNPIAIIAPCHRVIGSSGALTGFAGGLDAKRYLLALEARGMPARSGQLLVC